MKRYIIALTLITCAAYAAPKAVITAERLQQRVILLALYKGQSFWQLPGDEIRTLLPKDCQSSSLSSDAEHVCCDFTDSRIILTRSAQRLASSAIKDLTWVEVQALISAIKSARPGEPITVQTVTSSGIQLASQTKAQLLSYFAASAIAA